LNRRCSPHAGHKQTAPDPARSGDHIYKADQRRIQAEKGQGKKPPAFRTVPALPWSIGCGHHPRRHACLKLPFNQSGEAIFRRGKPFASAIRVILPAQNVIMCHCRLNQHPQRIGQGMLFLANLLNWAEIATSTQDSLTNYEMNDATATRSGSRFYQLHWP